MWVPALSQAGPLSPVLPTHDSHGRMISFSLSSLSSFSSLSGAHACRANLGLRGGPTCISLDWEPGLAKGGEKERQIRRLLRAGGSAMARTGLCSGMP